MWLKMSKLGAFSGPSRETMVTASELDEAMNFAISRP
jgi:hypothetical protein